MKVRKRIAVISPGLGGGGAERVAAIIANHLSTNYDVLFIAALSSDRKYFLSENVKYKCIDGVSDNKLIRMVQRNRRIYNELRNFKAEASISFIVEEMLLSTLRGINCIYSLRNDPNAKFKGSKLKKFLYFFSYRRAKAIVFQTPDARDYFDERIRKKGVVIGNPLTSDLPYWIENKHNNSIITACRLSPQKNLPMLIKGFASFSLNHPDYSLWIYGEGELKDSLLELAKELKIEDKVYLPGFVENIHEIMIHSSIFALTSDYEGLSNSMLEALAIGIPTICTDCPPGGASLYIKDHINGFLVPVGNERALTNALCEVADSEQLQSSISREAIKIRTELSEDKIIEQWIKLL